MSEPLKVVAAATKVDGEVYSLPPPARHHTILHHLADKGFKTPVVGVQGFLLSNGQFVTRKAAAKIALKAKQIAKLGWPPNLFSEDLW